MTTNRLSSFSAFFILLYLLSNSGCTPVPPTTEISLPKHTTSNDENITAGEPTDSSCSYFYYLWGVHAENNNHLREAEEAFEKALICDPNSRSVLRRLPILLMKMGEKHGAAKWLQLAIQKFPLDLQDRLLLSRLYVHDGKTEKAIALLKEIIELTPNDETAYLRLGLLYSKQKRFQEAKKTFKHVLSLNKNSLFTHLYLARLAIRNNNLDEAQFWYKKALKINWSTDLALEVAELYNIQKNFTKVKQLYRTILKRHPEETRAGLRLVQLLLLEDNEPEAFHVLQKLRENTQDPQQIDIIAASLYLRVEKLDTAVAILEPLTKQNNPAEAAYILAVVRYQQKQYNQALQLLHVIEPDSSHFHDAIYLQVRILTEQQQNTQAINLLTTTIANEEIAIPEFYTLLASLLMEQNQATQGYKVLETALQKYPNNAQLYFEYGLLLEQDGSQQQAIKRMEKVLELEPDHAEALNYLGYTWADKNINLDKALQYIQQSMRLKPGNWYIQDSLGWVYFRMGEYDLAVHEILEALTLEPADPHIYEHLGDIYLALKDQKKAKRAYMKAKELFKDHNDKIRILEKINGIL